MSDDEHEREEREDPSWSEGVGRRRIGESEGGYGEEGGKGHQESKTRTRTMMTTAQLVELRGLWNTSCGGDSFTRFPTTSQREGLAQKIGLTPRKVQVWFQNQRQKSRRVELEDASASLASISSSSSSAPFPPPPSTYQHPSLPSTSSYAYQPIGDVPGARSSTDQTARQPSYLPYSVSPLTTSNPAHASLPSYSYYSQKPPQRPNLTQHVHPFPRPTRESSYSSHRPPTQEPYEQGFSHLSPPLRIQPRPSYDEERTDEERRASEWGRRRSEGDGAQETRVESWNARRGWETGRGGYETGARDGGLGGAYSFAEVGPSRRSLFEEEEPEAGGRGSFGWSSAFRDASNPGSTTSSHLNTSTSRQNGYPSFHDSPFIPRARTAPSHELLPPSPRPQSPHRLSSPNRPVSPPFFSPVHQTTTGSQQHPSTPPRSLKQLGSRTVALPSIGSLLLTTSTSTATDLPFLPSTVPIPPSLALRRSNYASSTSSSSNSSYSFRSRPTSSSSSRGLGGANEGRRGRAHHHTTSSSTSSPPRFPNGSSNGSAALLSLSTFTFPSSATNPNQGLVFSSLANESSSRSTLNEADSHPPRFGTGSLLAQRGGPSSFGGSSSSLSSSQRDFLSPSTSDHFSTSFLPISLPREGFLSDQATNSGREINGRMGAGEEGLGLGLGAAHLPEMLDFVGFGGRAGLGRFSISSGGSSTSSEWGMGGSGSAS